MLLQPYMKARTSITVGILALIMTVFCDMAISQEDSALTIKQAPRQEITVYCGDREVAIHHSGTAIDKSYIHPLWTPDKRVITYDSPADHVHHRGLCVGWPDVSGEDFWAEVHSPDGHRGRIVPVDLATSTLPDGGAEIIEQNVWVRENGEVLVREKRVWTFHPPKGNLQLVDVDLTLVAVAEKVVFGSDKEKPRAYHGFTLRNGPFEDPRFFNSSGDEGGQTCQGKAAKWCAISGTQGGRPVTAAILNHPSNDPHPTKFYVQDRHMQFISSSPNMDAPKVLNAGEEWHLRYRVVAAGKSADDTPWDLEALWKEYADRSGR
ncbi:MAG: PmoA family protein [bacterium]